MGVQREDLETPDLENDSEDKAREEREALQKELEEARIARARAEGEAEALKRVPQSAPVSPVSNTVTDEQWQHMENESGMTRQQIQGNAKLFGAMFQNMTKPLQDRTESAEREAKEAREDAKKARASTSLYAIEQDFYSKNPGLVGRKGDVEEFLSTLPDETRSDPKKLSKALDMAKTYVRGKAREDLSLRRGNKNEVRNTTDSRQEIDDGAERNDEAEVDTTDLDNEGSISLIKRLANNPGPGDYSNSPDLRDMPLDKAYEKTQRKDGRGVAIDESGEFYRGAKNQDRALDSGTSLGGKRGR